MVSVGYSPDGSRLAGASGGQVKVWDARTDAEVFSLRTNRYEVNAFGNEITTRSYELRKILSEPISFKGVDDPKTTLEEALDALGKTCNVTFDVNEKAFAFEQLKDVLKTEVAQPTPIPEMKATLATVLREILARVPVGSGATWVIRKDVIEITTQTFLAVEKGLRVYPGNFIMCRSWGDWQRVKEKGLLVNPVDVSPDGETLTEPNSEFLRLWRRPPLPYGYDPWAEDRERRMALAPAWHDEDAAAAEDAGDWFAAAFHRRLLAERLEVGEPRHLYHLAWIKLAAGDHDSYRAICRRLCMMPPDAADLQPLFHLSAVLACGPAALPASLAAPATANANVRRVGLLRAAYGVRAAALTPSSGMGPEDLVKLAHRAEEAGLPDSDCRELLGATLYRAGRYEEAVKVLKGGSSWQNLFLAMAYHHLGQPDKAREWFAKAKLDDKAGWEHRLVYQRLRQEAEKLLQSAAKPQR
jgi:hypothetical protein